MPARCLTELRPHNIAAFSELNRGFRRGVRPRDRRSGREKEGPPAALEHDRGPHYHQTLPRLDVQSAVVFVGPVEVAFGGRVHRHDQEIVTHADPDRKRQSARAKRSEHFCRDYGV